MQLTEYIRIAIRSIMHRKMRSWLTVIGIIIGIAAITSLLTLSESLSGSIEEQFESFGANLVMVVPNNFQGPASFGSSQFISEDDVDLLENMPEFKEVIPMRYTQTKVTFHENEVYGYAASFEVSDPDILEDMGIEFEDGRWLERGETNVVVLGHLLAHEAFEEEVHVKNRIEVNDERYVVIGIVESVGNTQDDMTMYLSNDDLIEIAGVDEIMTIMAFTHSGIDVSEAAEKTQLKLNRARHDEDLRVMTSEDILERINQVLGILNLVLVGVAGISLLVGSVGIMNTMYTAVLERTKEIGIMKAIGAANNEIMMIFLIESAIFGILGGSIGALIGTLMAKSVEAAAGAFFFTFTVSPSPMIIGASILFAGIIGGVAGAFPAYRASKLSPTDALRYE